MSDVIHYTCEREHLPTVEAALAAHGYRIDLPRQQILDDATLLVMTCGFTNILLTDDLRHERAEIEIWGLGKSVAIRLLESLPIELHRSSVQAPIGEADTVAVIG